MNCLSQIENGIFADKKELKKLETQKESKILVISDTHGAKEYLTLIIEQFGPNVDAVIFTGDGIYDLIYVMEKGHKYRDAAKWLPPVIAFVRGNNDPSFASADFNETITVPSKVLLKAGNRNILVTHGHNESVYYDISTLEQCAATYNANTVLYGHTHVPFEILTRKAYIMNPGSIGYPRNHSKPGFAILEISEKAVYSIFYKIDFDSDIHFTPYHPEIFY